MSARRESRSREREYVWEMYPQRSESKHPDPMVSLSSPAADIFPVDAEETGETSNPRMNIPTTMNRIGTGGTDTAEIPPAVQGAKLPVMTTHLLLRTEAALHLQPRQPERALVHGHQRREARGDNHLPGRPGANIPRLLSAMILVGGGSVAKTEGVHTGAELVSQSLVQSRVFGMRFAFPLADWSSASFYLGAIAIVDAEVYGFLRRVIYGVLRIATGRSLADVVSCLLTRKLFSSPSQPHTPELFACSHPSQVVAWCAWKHPAISSCPIR
ncbi:hypothetical protein HDK77DRAFT_103094 [Phyllosticta capitalensis]|uniref:Uncharacterized protein n=1 Tax=Phyllosticta capitalensis TaxID=121624 RepID=A0ABR1YB95_9PEZI